MDAHLRRRIGEGKAWGSHQRLQGWGQNVRRWSNGGWISFGACALQINRIGQSGLIHQRRLFRRCVLAERRGNTGGNNARNETNTRGDPAHSKQQTFGGA